ncbi:MAG: AsnC family transcriptional regulator [Geminicoccaceae bacterium]|nr:AsnC family transcriptional regulator [Geminicoccaceae bacterium]
MSSLDPIDRRIVEATQAGLPFEARPYHAVAEKIGIEADELMARLRRMLEKGVIRRIGAVPNHYALGWTANGMSVWDVEDDALPALGPEVGGLPFVSHCYRRPRKPPLWPYNLFAMVHGRQADEVTAKVEQIARLLGPASRRHDVLTSTRILKKTGLRL